MKSVNHAFIALLVAFSAASEVRAANIAFTFDSSAEGWQNSAGGNTLSWVSSGGDPGGYIEDVTPVIDSSGGGLGMVISSPDLHLSAADYGDTLQFDVAVWYSAPDLNSQIYQAPTISSEYISFGGNPLGGGLEQPLTLSLTNGSEPVWNQISLVLQAPGWATTSGPRDAAQMETFLAGDPLLEIQAIGDLSGPAHWQFGLAIDNVSLTSATPEPASWLLMATAAGVLYCLWQRRATALQAMKRSL
jgi:hypothetical protein